MVSSQFDYSQCFQNVDPLEQPYHRSNIIGREMSMPIKSQTHNAIDNGIENVDRIDPSMQRRRLLDCHKQVLTRRILS